MSEFNALFEQALADERSATSAQRTREAVLARAVHASATRRTVRASAMAFATIVAMGVTGLSAWAVANRAHEPATPDVSPSPTSSPSASADGTPQPFVTEAPGITDGGVERLAQIEDWSTEGSPAYPDAPQATRAIIESATDFWSLVTIQDTTVLDSETGLPRLPIALYLVAPDGTYYLVMKLPAWYGTHYRLLDWQPRTAYVMMQTADGTETFVSDLSGLNRFEGNGIGERLGIASNGRAYWVFSNPDGSGFTVAFWSILISQQWEVQSFDGATLPAPLHWNATSGEYDEPFELADHGEWIAYPTEDPARGPLEAINLTTGQSVRFSGPGGDAACTPLHWRTTTQLLMTCPNTAPGVFSVEAPIFDNPVAFTGFVTVSDELRATGAAEIPGTGIVLRSEPGTDLVTSVGFMVDGAATAVVRFDSSEAFRFGTVREPRSGVFVIGELDGNGVAGTAVVVDVNRKRVTTYAPPPTAVEAGAYWLRLIYISGGQ